MIENLNKHIQNDHVLLFKCDEANSLKAIFDEKGFYLSDIAQKKYDEVKSKPHLYVAFTKCEQGFYYIGKSFQKGGRWKRQHAYHLGTLAYHLLDCIRYDDQNHLHWVDSWMDIKSKQIFEIPFSIALKESVYIVFIPFDKYSNQDFTTLSKSEIREINTVAETALIEYFKSKKIKLLNIQNNKKPASN